jgi:2-polyprenyl-3-methyl-5-hydroxy-6-metoxy-1,4-benzoquinol methylase
MPLILPVQVICNTSDDDLHDNIRINSRRPGVWVKQEEPNDDIAVICGSGPSLKDDIAKVRSLARKGAKIFALNGAAKFLYQNGVFADYQVIIDAREQTADLVGPAREYLFGSQVHPKCFEKAPAARVWHLQIGNIERLFPEDGSPEEHPEPYCLIGGAASVGNTATCLAYAMGYRNLQLFGYDSSHKDGKGHAFSQPMNAGDPCAYVKFNGKDYLTSFTMKLQAEKFQRTAKDLQAMGCHIEVHGSGLLPDMWHAPKVVMTEREKYELMYAMPEYRVFSPGEHSIEKFLQIANPKGHVIDFGCGTGRAGLRMKEAGLDVLLIDFTSNSRDLAAMNLPFLRHDLTQHIPFASEFGYCTDVMEHIPPEDVDTVFRNIMESASCVYFQICTAREHFGELIGQELHLTVEDSGWWEAKIKELGYCIHWKEVDESRYIASFLVFNHPLHTA